MIKVFSKPRISSSSVAKNKVSDIQYGNVLDLGSFSFSQSFQWCKSQAES